MGHLWQNRFYSCALDEAHLWVALRYLERNPVRGNRVARPEEYEWSSAYVIQANQGTLVLEKVLPKACTISGTYHYSTGMNGNRDYAMAGQGPLPPGNYTLHPYEIGPAGFFRK